MEKPRQIVIDGLKIRETVIGDGAPVLMIHGWGAHHGLLLPLAERIAGRNFQALLPDLPGFGESDEPAAPFSIFDYAEFCLAYLERHKLKQVHYFGHSLGGRIGLILASDHSKYIKRMVLSNSAGIMPKRSLSSQLRARLYQSVRGGVRRLGADSLAEKLRQSYSKRYASPDYQAASPLMRSTLVKVVNQDLLDNARRVSVPTVLIWGDADVETPLWMGEKLERAIPDCALIVHEGAGHYAYLDFPEKTAAITRALFDG